MPFKRARREVLRRLLQDRERFELWTGLGLFTVSLLLFLGGWTALRGGPGEWTAVVAALAAMAGLMGLSGKVPLSGIFLNRGLAVEEPKRGGQIAVVYGAALFGIGVFGLSSVVHTLLAPSGAYGLAAMLSTALILGGLYVVGSTPVFERTHPARFEADNVPEPQRAWFDVDAMDGDGTETAVAAVEETPFEESQPACAVPQVRPSAATKRPAMLGPDDILAYAMIDWDWLETPSSYTCVAVEDPQMGRLVESGDLVGINHSVLDTRWLIGKLVAVAEGEKVLIGILREEEDQWFLNRQDDDFPIVIEPVTIIGAVEWSVKPRSATLRPVGEPVAQTSGREGERRADNEPRTLE